MITYDACGPAFSHRGFRDADLILPLDNDVSPKK